MRAGRLRHRAVFQTPPSGADDLGQPSTTWTTLVTRDAFVEPIRGGEKYRSDQDISTTMIRVVTRYESQLYDPKLRIQHDSRTLEIVSVRNIEELGREIEFICKEVH